MRPRLLSRLCTSEVICKAVVLAIGLTLLLWLLASQARAEEVIEAWRGGDFDQPDGVSVNWSDGSVWVTEYGQGWAYHLAADGTVLWQGGGFEAPCQVSVNHADGSVWLADDVSHDVVHLVANGTELWRGHSFSHPVGVSVNPTDGSCWITDVGFWGEETGRSAAVIHLAEDGTELWRGQDFVYSASVSVNAADGSCWVADDLAGEVIHVAPNGDELLRLGSLGYCSFLSVNSADGSCWVTDYREPRPSAQIVHLAEDGTELWRGYGFSLPGPISVNPFDGSCWVADTGAGEVFHLSHDGTELWRGEGFDHPWRVAVDPMDGSCWLTETGTGQVVRLVVVGYEGPHFPDIVPYHWAFNEVEACADAEIVGGYGDGLYHPANPVSRDQMAVFISRSICTPTGEAGLVDYVPPTTPSFSDVPTDFWCYKYIEYAVEHTIVGGYGDGTYQPQLALDRGQMAVFIARAMAGDDESVPDPTGDPSFPDLPADFWSYRHIEYIADQEVAGGYFDGLYHPGNPVDRAQMAVFICRAFHLT